MAYEKRNNSILRRSLALVMCCCLLLCVAVPRAHAVDPVTLTVSGTILVTSILVALGFMDATNAGQAFSNMVEDIVNSGIDLSWLTPQGLAEVLTSSYEDVAYVDTAFVDFVNTEAIELGYYLDSSFTYTPSVLSHGDVASSFTGAYTVYSYINNSVCSVDSHFADWWNVNSSAYLDLLRGSPYSHAQIDSHGLVYVDWIAGNKDFTWTVDKSTAIPRLVVDTTGYDVYSDTGPQRVRISRADDGTYSVELYNSWRSESLLTSSVDSSAGFKNDIAYYIDCYGNISIDDFAFNPPATIPEAGVSVTTLFPDWGAKEIGGTLPIYCPGTEAEVLDATQEEAQVIQFPSGDNNNNNDDDPDYTPNFKVLERILNLSTAGIVGKFLDLFDLLSEWFQKVIDSIVERGQAIVDAVNGFKTTFVSGFNQWMQRVYSLVGTVNTTLTDFFADFWASLETALSNVIDAIQDASWDIQRTITFLNNYLSSIESALESIVAPTLCDILTWVQTFFETLVENWHDFWDGLISKVSTLTDVVSDHLANFWENLQAKLQPLLDPIIEAIENLPKGFRDWKEKFKRYLSDGFGFTNIWHYVTSWIGCISGFVGQILAIWSKLPYCMVVPVYACVTLTIVFGMYRRFIR